MYLGSFCPQEVTNLPPTHNLLLTVSSVSLVLSILPQQALLPR